MLNFDFEFDPPNAPGGALDTLFIRQSLPEEMLPWARQWLGGRCYRYSSMGLHPHWDKRSIACAALTLAAATYNQHIQRAPQSSPYRRKAKIVTSGWAIPYRVDMEKVDMIADEMRVIQYGVLPHLEASFEAWAASVVKERETSRQQRQQVTTQHPQNTPYQHQSLTIIDVRTSSFITPLIIHPDSPTHKYKHISGGSIGIACDRHTRPA